MDPIRTAVMNSRFTAIVEEASAILHRTAYTTFVKLVQDYQCAIATPEGDIFAYPSQSGVHAFIGTPLQATLDLIGRENFAPGDLYITNDPFSTDGLVTHLMDVTMLYPIFLEEKLVAVAWAYVHASDIGGAVPGSISPAFTEVFQEGARIRPMRLFRQGVLVPEVKNLFLDNTRIPEDIWGDFNAMISALKSIDRRFLQLCTRYGLDEVQAGMSDVLDFAEQKSRAVIASIPDGSYAFGDYIEGIDEGQYAFVNTLMHVRGEEVELDFTGSEPQMAAAYNFVSGDKTHPYLVQALLFYILTVQKGAPRNAGLLRPIKTRAPRGTVMNAVLPAAGGSRVASSARISDTIIACLNLALPGGLMAGGSGMAGVIAVSSRDPRTGRNRVSVVNPICGGSGGRLGHDGVNGVDPRFGHLKSVPAEMTEIETSLRIKSLRLVVDSQAAGAFQGGAALAIEIENKGPRATMIVRGMNRFHFRPWGLAGGSPGSKAKVVSNPRTPAAHDLGRITVVQIPTDETVEITSPCGGGFGDPATRQLSRIAQDLKYGLITREKASRDYGVVFSENGDIDMQASERARTSASSKALPGEVSRGVEMERYRRIWPDAVRAMLSNMVLAEDLSVRGVMMARVRDTLTERAQLVDTQSLIAAYRSIRNEVLGSDEVPTKAAEAGQEAALSVMNEV